MADTFRVYVFDAIVGGDEVAEGQTLEAAIAIADRSFLPYYVQIAEVINERTKETVYSKTRSEDEVENAIACAKGYY
jgi:hypothetical protein